MLQQISQNIQTLLNAGNRNCPLSKQEKQGDDEMTYDNHLQQILNTKLTRINAFLCGDEGVAHADRQYSTWVTTGLIVTMILMPVGVLSLLGIAICTLAITRRHDRCEPSWVVINIVSNVISWLMIFASFLTQVGGGWDGWGECTIWYATP